MWPVAQVLFRIHFTFYFWFIATGRTVFALEASTWNEYVNEGDVETLIPDEAKHPSLLSRCPYACSIWRWLQDSQAQYRPVECSAEFRIRLTMVFKRQLALVGLSGCRPPEETS